MDYYLDRIRKENEYVVECLNGKVKQLEQEILDLEGEKLEKDQRVCELNMKFNKFETESMENNQILGKYVDKLGQVEVESQIWESQKVEKNKIIYQLHNKITKLQDEIMDSDLSMVAYEEIIRELNEEIVKVNNNALKKDQAVKLCEDKVGLLEHEIQELNGEKLTANQMIDEMRCKLLAAYETIDEMKYAISKESLERKMIINESNESMGKLENQILEKNHVVRIYKEKLELSNSNMRKLERENQELKGQILSAGQTIKKVISRPLDANLTIDDIKCQRSKGHWKKKIVKEWNEEMSKLENKMLGKDQDIVIYQKNVKCSNGKVEELGRKSVDRLRSQAFVPTNEVGNCDIKSAPWTMPKVLSWTVTKRPRSCLQKKGSKVQWKESDRSAAKKHQAGLLSENSIRVECSGMDRENKCKRLKRTETIEAVPSFNQMDSEDELCDESSIRELLTKIQSFK